MGGDKPHKAGGGETFCHMIGVLSTIIAIGCVVAGSVVICIYKSPDQLYWIGIAVLSIGVSFSFITLIYTCLIFKYRCPLFGCISIKPMPGATLRSFQHGGADTSRDTRESQSLPRMGMFDGSAKLNSVYTGSGRGSGRGVDWDPETVLAVDS